MSILSFFTTALLLASYSNAAPVVEEKRAIKADQLSTFKLMGQYAAAAYCANNFVSSGSQMSCPGGDCPQVEAADAATVTAYSRLDTSTDVTGYIAVDHTNKLVVVSFRGSLTVDAWVTNYEFDTVDSDVCSGCTAHRGFWNSWVIARDTVNPAVQQASATFPKYKIVVVGHSLGGAVATLAAASLRNSGYKVALYNFGSPRVGGAKISNYITNQSGGNFRFTHRNDLVPKVPLMTMGYNHISPEYYIDTPNQPEVTAQDISVFKGTANLFVGNQASLIWDPESHRWYFGSQYYCDAKSKRGTLNVRDVEEDIAILTRF
ncbi:hypothetical protein HBI83_221260 [Parastagonospora nodorum]|nr:hypothetical protein HBI83_221260 [Parastagonospora nodorum]